MALGTISAKEILTSDSLCGIEHSIVEFRYYMLSGIGEAQQLCAEPAGKSMLCRIAK
jgi:hypothetical protein